MIRYLVLLSVLIISFSCEKQTISTSTPSPTHNSRDVVSSSLPEPIKSIIPTPEPTPPLGVDKLPRELLVIDDGYLKVIDKDVKVKTNIYVGYCGREDTLCFTGFLQNKKAVLQCSSKFSKNKTFIVDLEKQTSKELKDIDGNSITNVKISEDKTKIYSPDSYYLNPNNKDLYVIDQNNLDNIKPTSFKNNVTRFSFSENKISFLQTKDKDIVQLCVIDPDGTNFLELPIIPKIYTSYDITPLISSDGKYIVATEISKIFIVSVDGKEKIDVKNKSYAIGIEWIKGTHELLFLERADIKYDLIKYNLDERKSEVIATNMDNFSINYKQNKLILKDYTSIVDFDGKNNFDLFPHIHKKDKYNDFIENNNSYIVINISNDLKIAKLEVHTLDQNTIQYAYNIATDDLIKLPEATDYEKSRLVYDQSNEPLIDDNFFIYFDSYYDKDIMHEYSNDPRDKVVPHVYSIKNKRNLNLELEKILSKKLSVLKWIE